jgi:hypothetical protein
MTMKRDATWSPAIVEKPAFSKANVAESSSWLAAGRSRAGSQFEAMSISPSVQYLPGSRTLLCALITLALAGEASAAREWESLGATRTQSEDTSASGIPRTDYFWAQQSNGEAGGDRWKAGQQANLSAGGNASCGLAVPASVRHVAPGIVFQEKPLTLARGACTLAAGPGQNGIILDTNFGHGTASNLTTVPEPRASTLVGTALFLLFARHRLLAPKLQVVTQSTH